MIDWLMDVSDRGPGWCATVIVGLTGVVVAAAFALVIVGVAIASVLPVWASIPLLAVGAVAAVWLFVYALARENFR